MAKKNYGNNCNNNQRGGSGKKAGRGKSKYSELENLAFNMGKIQSGLARDTRVKESYEKGKASATAGSKKKKPLC